MLSSFNVHINSFDRWFLTAKSTFYFLCFNSIGAAFGYSNAENGSLYGNNSCPEYFQRSRRKKMVSPAY